MTALHTELANLIHEEQHPRTPPPGFRRIVVVGSSGAGKTTLARALSQRLGVPHIELDAIRHGPNWVETPDDLFRERLAERVRAEAWVVDGSYGFARDISWGRAERVVWLDYPFPTVMTRLIRRTLRRIVIGEELWNGNCESLRLALSPDSVVVWAVKTLYRRRRQMRELSARPEYAHLQVLRFRSPAETNAWLAGLPHDPTV